MPRNRRPFLLAAGLLCGAALLASCVASAPSPAIDPGGAAVASLAAANSLYAATVRSIGEAHGKRTLDDATFKALMVSAEATERALRDFSSAIDIYAATGSPAALANMRSAEAQVNVTLASLLTSWGLAKEIHHG